MKESRDYTSDNIIAVILEFMGSPGELVRITGDLLAIHKAVCDLREQYPLLQEFTFQRNENPISPLLEKVMLRLQTMVLKPMDGYTVNAEAKQVIEERIHQRFDSEQLAELQEIANELTEQLAVSMED